MNALFNQDNLIYIFTFKIIFLLPSSPIDIINICERRLLSYRTSCVEVEGEIVTVYLPFTNLPHTVEQQRPLCPTQVITLM